MTTKKKKAPTPKPVRAVIIRVQWTPEDYARLVRIEPRLTDPREHNVEMLVNLLRSAQKQLPSERQMTPASVRQRVTQNMPKVLASIAAAKAANGPVKASKAAAEPLTPLLDLPSPAQTVAREPAKEVLGPQVAQVAQEVNVEQVEQVEQLEPTRRTFADRVLVRWNAREHSLIAHEVSALLRKDSKVSAPDLVAAVMRAQAKVLPRERWRPRTGLMQGCYKGDRDKLIDRLREGMKTQVGLHVSPVVPSVPESAAAPIPTSEPPVSTAPATSTGSAIEEAIVALVRKVVREGMPILAQAVAEHAVGLLRGDLGNLLSNIDTTVRKSVTEVVGGPTEPQQAQPSQPAPSLSVVPPAAVPATPEKQRVDVIGLLNAQANVVRSAMGKKFDLRFIDSNFAEHQRSVAPIVVLCTKFVNHSAQEKAKSHGAHVLFANGAAQSVIEQLQHLQTKKPHDLHASGRA